MNSVQLTPLEALDALHDLRRKGLWTEELVARLKTSVARGGLDRPVPSDGRREYLRRRYLCPLFLHKSFGCPLTNEAKPYGCLAFNPTRAGVRDGEACSTDRPLLEQREETSQDEAKEQAALRARLTFDWEKRPLPVALLAISAAMDHESARQV